MPKIGVGGNNLAMSPIYFISQKGIKKTQNNLMGTTKVVFIEVHTF